MVAEQLVGGQFSHKRKQIEQVCLILFSGFILVLMMNYILGQYLVQVIHLTLIYSALTMHSETFSCLIRLPKIHIAYWVILRRAFQKRLRYLM